MYNRNNDNNNEYQKFSGKIFFVEFQLKALENNRTFMKKAVLHTTTLMHCKARQLPRDLVVTKQMAQI